jgi:hypothetical protein
MRRSILVTSLVGVGISLALSSGCSGSSSSDAGNNDAGNTGNDSGNPGNDAGPADSGSQNDAGGMDSGVNDAGSTDAGTVTLTVKNYRRWCAVSIDDGAFSTDAGISVDVAPGTIPLAAKPASDKFILGDWHYTTGSVDGGADPGMVDGGVSYSSVVVGGSAACIWVCCPFADAGGCDIADQCP